MLNSWQEMAFLVGGIAVLIYGFWKRHQQIRFWREQKQDLCQLASSMRKRVRQRESDIEGGGSGA